MLGKEHTFWQDTRIFYIFLFLFFLVINFLTPYNGDDYTYEFNFADHTRITNLFDVLESQYVHYLTSNGRTIPHLFEQFFAGVSGKWLFNILNSVMLVILIQLITKVFSIFIPQWASHKFLTINILLLSVLFLFSYPGQSMLWMAGGVNYLWPTVFALITWLLFESKKKYNLYLVGLSSLLFGWCQEAISIPFCASMWLILLLDKEKRTPKNWVIALCYALGTLLIVFAPGTLSRLSSNEVKLEGGILYLLVFRLLETLACFRGLYIYWISFILLVICLFSKHRSKTKSYEHNAFKDLIILWIMNSLFFLALGFNQERITLFLSVISLIISFYIISQLNFIRVVVRIKILKPLFFVLSLVSCYYVIDTCYAYKVWNQHIISSIVDNPEEHIVLQTDTYDKNSRFIYAELLNKHADSGHNRGFSLYFDKKSIQFIDTKLYDSIEKVKKTQRIVHTYHSSDSLFKLCDAGSMYYIKLPISYFEEGVKVICRHEAYNENLLKRQKFIRGILGTLDNGTTRVEHCTLRENDDECCCYIPKVSTKEESLIVLSRIDKSPICEFDLNKDIS